MVKTFLTDLLHVHAQGTTKNISAYTCTTLLLFRISDCVIHELKGVRHFCFTPKKIFFGGGGGVS